MSIYTLKNDPFSSHSLIARELFKIHPKRVLDVGCANGLIAKSLAQLSKNQQKSRLWGIDIDPQAVKQAQKYYEEVWNMDVEKKLPRISKKFDCLVFGDVLEHLTNPWKTLKKLVENLLAEDGTTCISLPNVANWYNRIRLLSGSFDYQNKGLLDRTHLRFFTKSSADNLLRQAGLSCVSFTVTPIPLPLIWKHTAKGKILYPVHYMNNAFTHQLPTLLGYQLIYICKKK